MDALPSRLPVHLFDFAIAGRHHYGLRAAREQLAAGTILTLMREADNPHDADAVAVHRADGLKLGFIPRIANTPIARLLDRGESVNAKVVRMLDLGRPNKIPPELVFTHLTSGDPMIRLTAESPSS